MAKNSKKAKRSKSPRPGPERPDRATHAVSHGRVARARGHQRFEHPLTLRYASEEMSHIWSPWRRHRTWRGVWIALAEAQQALGLGVTPAQIRAMRVAADEIDFAAAARYEREFRHDVMAHIHAFGDVAPGARGVIHWGATSMDVVDNADLVLIRDALDLLLARLAATCVPLAEFCEAHADLPALGFTHLQPAQLTTVGKRAALWLQDLCDDLERLATIRAGLKCRGLRGATGTQASFLKLLGSPAKVRALEADFAVRLGFDDCYDLCGQTYSRKVDVEIIHALASFAAGVQKICNDVRLLAMLKEMDEPFGSKQVGSSAMPYKRNPMRCERATGLARYLVSLADSPTMTLAAQMFERTLDDSSNKRLVFPEAFLTADAICLILREVFDGLVVYPKVIAARIAAELPFIASEDILMAAVKAGADRQELHERIRRHAQAAGARVKQDGAANDLIERLRTDSAFARVRFDEMLDARRYVGLAPAQTREFLKRRARPLIRRFLRPEFAASAPRV